MAPFTPLGPPWLNPHLSSRARWPFLMEWIPLLTKICCTFPHLHSFKSVSSKNSQIWLPTPTLLKVIFLFHKCHRHITLPLSFYFLYYTCILNLWSLLECKFLKVKLCTLFNFTFCLLPLLPKVSSRGLTHRGGIINIWWKNQWNAWRWRYQDFNPGFSHSRVHVLKQYLLFCEGLSSQVSSHDSKTELSWFLYSCLQICLGK